jgi:hypothetical protein
MLRREYFLQTIVPADGVCTWARGFLPEVALLTIYRASFFYGATRGTVWMLWAHVVHHYPIDLSWGGPHWAR